MPPVQTAGICSGWGQEIARLVEQHIADAAAEHDAESSPGEEIVGLLDGGDGRGEAHQAAHDLPADDQADDVGQGVPADLQRPQVEQHRVEVREHQYRQHAGPILGKRAA